MSLVERNGKPGQRPCWNYRGDPTISRGIQLDTLEMLESIRNCLEQIRDKQMLQCDVRSDIRESARTLRAINRKLRPRRKK